MEIAIGNALDIILYALELLLFLSICWYVGAKYSPKARKTAVFNGGEKFDQKKIAYTTPMVTFTLLFLALDGALFLLLLSLNISFTPVPYVIILLITVYPLFLAGEKID